MPFKISIGDSVLPLAAVFLCSTATSIASDHEIAKESDCLPTTMLTEGNPQQKPATSHTRISLKPNETATVLSVNPKCKYFPTLLNVEPGETYAFTSQGRWKDGGIATSPTGWNGIIANFFNRVRGRNFFYLCGSIGKTDKTSFPIGKEREWTVPSDLTKASSSLYLFPNDWNGQWFRDNNASLAATPLQVTIRRLR